MRAVDLTDRGVSGRFPSVLEDRSHGDRRWHEPLRAGIIGEVGCDILLQGPTEVSRYAPRSPRARVGVGAGSGISVVDRVEHDREGVQRQVTGDPTVRIRQYVYQSPQVHDASSVRGLEATHCELHISAQLGIDMLSQQEGQVHASTQQLHVALTQHVLDPTELYPQLRTMVGLRAMGRGSQGEVLNLVLVGRLQGGRGGLVLKVAVHLFGQKEIQLK